MKPTWCDNILLALAFALLAALALTPDPEPKCHTDAECAELYQDGDGGPGELPESVGGEVWL